MNSYRSDRASNNWLFIMKIIILILGLYISAVILSKVFTWVLGIVFALVKVFLFITAAILVLHLFLKLLFNFDLLRFLFGGRFRRYYK